MKKFLSLLVTFMISVFLFGQTQIYFDNFESPPYNVPGKLAYQNSDWMTWDNQSGTDQDADISNLYSYNGSQSVQINTDNGTENDVVYLTKSRTSGFFKIGFYMFVPTGKSAYFNIQQLFDPSTSTYEWGMQVYLRVDGTTQVDAGGTGVASPNYSQNTWIYHEIFIDLDADYAEYYLDDQFIVAWQFSTGWDGNGNTNELQGLDLYAWNQNSGTAEFYVDDFNFIQLNPPENLTYTLYGNDVNLTWDTPQTKSLMGFVVYRDGTPLDTVPTNVYTDPNRDAGSFDYYVTALYDDTGHNPDESAPSNTVTATINFYNFEDASAGTDQVACYYGLPWNTWDNSPCSSTDAYIVSTQAYSGSNSTEVTGISDLVYDAGNVTSGNYKLSFYMYIPSGKKGYFNVLQEFDPAGGNYQWGMQVTFENGTATLDADGSASATYSYTPDTWGYQEIFIDLDVDTAFYYFNSTLVKSWKWSKGTFGNNNLNQLGGVDFYALDGNTNGLYYFDDYSISEVKPPVNLTYSLISTNVNLSWDEPVNSTLPLLGYNVYRDGSKINSSLVTSEYYTDANLSAGTYTYFVTAVYDDGSQADDESGPSNTVSVSIGYQNTLDFDGSNDYVSIANASDINTGGPYQNRTIELWFYAEDVSKNTKQMIFEEGGGVRGFNIYLYNGSLYVGGWNRDANQVYWAGKWLTTNAVSSHRWHHVTLKLENGTNSVEPDKFKAYLDGIEFGSGEGSAVYAHGGNIRLGNSGNTRYHDGTTSTGNYFEGKIEEFRLWNEARTLQQIRDDMHRELLNPTSETNLIVYYKFNQASGTTLPDMSSNSHNGTLHNMTPATDWVASTAPIPYYSVQSGNWSSDATWDTGQMAPVNDWARVIVDDDVILDQNQGLYDLVINSTGSLTVNAGHGLTMYGDIANYAGTSGLILKADNTGTMASLVHNTAGVEATVEEYLLSQQWHYVSSPVAEATIQTYFDIYLMEFNEPTGAWTYLVNPVTTPMNVCEGYAAWTSDALTGSTTVSFEGTLNTGDINYTGLDYTPISNNTGYNLVGNPYPSFIEWNSNWTRNNVDATAYFYNGTAYVTWNANTGVGTASDGIIPPTQGFVVMANASGASLTFPQSERFNGSKPFYKGSSVINESVTLSVERNGYAGKLIVGFSDLATGKFDHELDAYYLKGSDIVPQLYVIGDVDYSVDILNPAAKEGFVPVGFETSSPGIYSLKIDKKQGFDDGIIIEDLKENSFVTLNTGDVYNFTVGTDDPAHRFNIHFKSATLEAGEISYNGVKIYSHNDIVYISKPTNLTGNISVVNIMGQEILKAKAGEGDMLTFRINSNPGCYIVNLQASDRLISGKVFIK